MDNLFDYIPTDEDREKLFEIQTDISAINLAALGLENCELSRDIQYERAKEEILQYMVGKINKEFKGRTEEDAFYAWDDYKKKHHIR